jgi:DNA recombination protein RmuC
MFDTMTTPASAAQFAFSPAWVVGLVVLGMALTALGLMLWSARRAAALLERIAAQEALATAAQQRIAALEQALHQAQTQLGQASGDHRHAQALLAALRERADVVEGSLQQSQAELRRENERAVLAERSLAVAGEEVQRKNEELVALRRWVEDNQKLMEERVANTANRLLEEKAQRFTEHNRKEIDAIVAPFKAQLTEFRQRVDLIYQHDHQDRAQLKEQIVQLTALNQTISKQAQDLTQALTISSKATGNWGETILRKILDDSGLREGHEYRLQVSLKSGDDADQRPDAVIDLPEQRQIVVDAKVSNKAWKDYCAATTDEERQRSFAEHLRSLRSHVKGLADKDYTQAQGLNTVDFVLMFIPVEGALLEALSRDPQLYEEAYKRKVILVVPSTLLAVIKLVEGMWTVERRQKNAERIAEAGTKLYDKLVLFAESFEAVGKAISATQNSYDKAMNQLRDGRGSATSLAERMRKLGITPGKGRQLPAQLLHEPESGPDDDAEERADDGL